MEKSVQSNARLSSETIFMNTALFKHIGQTLINRVSREEMESMYYLIGKSSGEDYCYNFLDLEDSPKAFLASLGNIHQHLCFPEITITAESSALDYLELCYTALPGCKEKPYHYCKMRCQFLKGYTCGILSTYNGKMYQSVSKCNGTSGQTSSCVLKFSSL